MFALIPHLFMQVTGSQNTMSPVGPAARSISWLAWIVYITLGVVTVAMWLLIAWLAVRKRGSFDEPIRMEPEGGQSWILVGGVMIPLAVLTALFVLNLDTLAGFPIHSQADPPPEIQVIGRQWWWQINYVAGPVDQHFTTANEIHIPVGQDIDIQLIGADVIHSFWVPKLNGKEDMIPGEVNMIRIRADQPGTFRGQCAEYCGAQHANMVILVVAQQPDEYNAWLARQRQPGNEPTSNEAKAGEQVFLNAACALCHTVRGTPAGGEIAPDLTHLASRQGLAANTLVNNTANLEAWITHAQSLKPNVIMPNLTQYTGVQLRDMVAYLQQLN